MRELTDMEAYIAALLRDWMAKLPRDKELFALASSFLNSIEDSTVERLPDSLPGNKVEQQKAWKRIKTRITGLPVEDNTLSPAIEYLEKRFGFSQGERKLVAFFYAYIRFGPLESFMDNLPDWKKIDYLSRTTGLTEPELLDLLASSGKLKRSGIARNYGHSLAIESRSIRFGLTLAVAGFLDSGGEKSLSSQLLDISEGPVLDLESFGIPEATLAAAKSTLSMPSLRGTVLLYGKPGTGKTEFSKSICKSLGLTPCFLKNSESSDGRTFAELSAASHVVDPQREVLVVDEADDFLNIETGLFDKRKSLTQKGLMNQFLDDSRVRSIFISNTTDGIQDSTLRRFHIHVRFEDLNPTQRLRVWTRLSADRGLFSEGETRRLAMEHKANPSRIVQVLDVCEAAKVSEAAPSNLISMAEDLLARGEEVMYGTPAYSRHRLDVYDLRFLNLGMPIDKLLSRLMEWRRHYSETDRGLNILFYGPPGTGKTALARHIAEELGLPPLVKRASDVLSPFVGMNERNLRDIFKEAKESVLIFDEIDGLLSDRRQTHGWERNLTNELLTCMEGFKGIFIATTNLESYLDTASLRRFAFKLEFKPPHPEQRFDLVSAYFPCLAWSDADRLAVAGIDGLTPGDVEVVRREQEYAVEIDPAAVLAALRSEVRSHERRNTPIGFAAR